MSDNDLSPEAILRDLKTRFIGQKIIYYPSLDTTMEAAKREALWGADAGTVIIAGQQTAGRGRMQRTWVSPSGGLAFSVILRPNIDYLPNMVMLTSLAVSYSIRTITGLKPHIKWPNDVLIKDRKVCGILIENDVRRNVLKHTVIGIGVNANLRMSDYPEIAPIATSLSDQLGKEVSKLTLIRQILTEMDRLYPCLAQNDYILEQWKSNLITLGQKVQVQVGEKILKGVAESVNRDGSLMLREDSGELTRIVAGDVNG